MVTAPANVEVVIEGERVRSGYQGMYFPDIELTADIAAEHRQGFTGWQINGRVVPGAAPLKFKAEQHTSASKRSSTTTSPPGAGDAREHASGQPR